MMENDELLKIVEELIEHQEQEMAWQQAAAERYRSFDRTIGQPSLSPVRELARNCEDRAGLIKNWIEELKAKRDQLINKP